MESSKPMALVTKTIVPLATLAPMKPPKNAPRASPNIVESQVLIGAEATRFATASGVAGSINSGGVGYIAFAINPTIRRVIVPTTAPKITARIFRISIFLLKRLHALLIA